MFWGPRRCGNYPLADRVVLRWVTDFHGSLEGGPYELTLVKDDAERQRLIGRPVAGGGEPLEIRLRDGVLQPFGETGVTFE